MEAFAKFLAVGSFFVRSRGLYMIVGDVTEGSLEPGMVVRIQLAGLLELEVPVRDVEVAEVAYEGTQYLGLTLEVADRDELDLLAALGVGGETLEVFRKPRVK